MKFYLPHAAHRLFRGYSLVEMVIYIGLLVLLLLALLSAVQLMMRTWGEVQSRLALAHSGELAMERLEREIRSATSVASGSAFGSSPGTLALSTTTSGTETEQFSVSGGMLYLTQGAGPAEPLLSPKVGVASLTFYEITTPNSQAVRVALELQAATTSANPVSATLYDTAVLRGSY